MVTCLPVVRQDLSKARLFGSIKATGVNNINIAVVGRAAWDVIQDIGEKLTRQIYCFVE